MLFSINILVVFNMNLYLYFQIHFQAFLPNPAACTSTSMASFDFFFFLLAFLNCFAHWEKFLRRRYCAWTKHWATHFINRFRSIYRLVEHILMLCTVHYSTYLVLYTWSQEKKNWNCQKGQWFRETDGRHRRVSFLLTGAARQQGHYH